MERSVVLMVVTAALMGIACSTDDSLPVDDYVCESVELTKVPFNSKLWIAHRGLLTQYPENTEEGLLAAIETEANSVELDVVMTRDNVVVVMHDYTLGRMTNCSGDIRDLDWVDIKDCLVDGAYGIPRLDELLPKLKIYDKYFVEIKTEDGQAERFAQEVGRIIDENLDHWRAVVTSYNLLTLFFLKQNYSYPRIHIAYDGTGATIPLSTLNMEFDYMLMRYTDIDVCDFSTAEQMGVKLITYTLDDVEELRDLFDDSDGDLFSRHLAGFMLDDFEKLHPIKGEIEKSLGLTETNPKDCEKAGKAWDPIEWLCEDRCLADSCDTGYVCDDKSGRCEPEAPHLLGIQTLFDEVAELDQYFTKNQEDVTAEALEDLNVLLADVSPYKDRPDLMADLFTGKKKEDPRKFSYAISSVLVTDPYAVVELQNGLQWFLFFEEGAWKVDHLQD